MLNYYITIYSVNLDIFPVASGPNHLENNTSGENINHVGKETNYSKAAAKLPPKSIQNKIDFPK